MTVYEEVVIILQKLNIILWGDISMKKHWIIRAVLYAVMMLMLIFDAKTALNGAKEGTHACINTVIPALFPLLFLSVLINGSITGNSIPILKPLGKLCKIPSGAESILLLGLIGGYPVGAQCIYQAYECKHITKSEAERMLGFCNNAGPAFIFGMASSLFNEPFMCWLLWGVHIASALMIGILLPGKQTNRTVSIQPKNITISKALTISGNTILHICGWVILFRVIISIAERWLKLICTAEVLAVITGFFELTNGCIAAAGITDEALRFICVSGMLALGGCCVFMQTVAATKDLGIGQYFQGKVLQCMVSILLSSLLMMTPKRQYIPIFAILILEIIILVIYLRKKTVAFHNNVVYNQ